jgi:hypothetical protein
MAIGQMGKAADDGFAARVAEAVSMLNAEEVVSVAPAIFESSSSQSLSSRDNSALRISEAAGIVLSSVTACLLEALEPLQSRNALSTLLRAASDADMSIASSLRGDAAWRCLGVLQTASTMLMRDTSGDSESVLPLAVLVNSGPFFSITIWPIGICGAVGQ